MNRPTRRLVLVALLASAASISACKKGEGDASPAASASAATSSVPVATAEAPAASATVVPVVTAPPVRQAPIDGCCAALAGIAKSGRDAATKKKAAQALLVCPGIAARVKSGEVPRSSGLTQIKSALTGMSIPSECN